MGGSQKEAAMNFLGGILHWVLPQVIFVGVMITFFIIKRILFGHLIKWSEKTTVRWDDILVRALRTPLTLIMIVMALWVTHHFLTLPQELKELIPISARLMIVLSMLLFSDRFIVGMLNEYASQYPAIESSQRVFRVVTHIVTGLFAGLFILNALGISITPFLASLGIGSMAIAFALQDTLSNAFAGMHMMIDRPVSRGQFVAFGDGREGFIESIGWRTTRIRLGSNNIVIIPNSKLSGSIITNYDMPTTESYIIIEGVVCFQNDLERVEFFILEEATKLMSEHPMGLKQFHPSVRFTQLDDSGVKFVASLGVKRYIDQGVIRSQFIKAIQKRFKAEGVQLPAPRFVYFPKEKNLNEVPAEQV